MAMSSIGRKEYIREVKKQYHPANKKQRGKLLDAAQEITGLTRKHLISCLSRSYSHARSEPAKETRGRKAVYNSSAFHTALLVCWHAANDICAERLQPFLPELVTKLESCGELRVSSATRNLLLSASRATVARQLATAKKRTTVPLGTTKPGSLLKSQIAVRKGRWEETNPGWLESDTVAHGGDSGAGQFIFTYDFVDIATGWVELEAVMGKGERATVVRAIALNNR